MAVVKLTYFKNRGIAELIRYIFAYGGQEYEDERIAQDDWLALKPDTPLGSMPYVVLENGVVYSEGTSIARYFAEKFNIRGRTAEEKLHSDMIVDLIRADLTPMFIEMFFEKNDDKLKNLRQNTQEKVDTWFQMVEDRHIKGHNSVLESGFSWADIALFNFINDYCPKFEVAVDEKFEKIHTIAAAVKKKPTIAAWIEKRPKTPW
ncbi:hematopoietic prostaglandin D synthase-like [Convolutriloba macropyga]|uniref:hematopoietic prostaglandin D synthase-like n=1 Tax=Convolutriloba macropyga TaxID=536237 RepID=UPI003F51B857